MCKTMYNLVFWNKKENRLKVKLKKTRVIRNVQKQQLLLIIMNSNLNNKWSDKRVVKGAIAFINNLENSLSSILVSYNVAMTDINIILLNFVLKNVFQHI